MAEAGSNVSKYRRTIGICRVAVVALAVLALALLIALIVVSVKLHAHTSKATDEHTCPKGNSKVDLEPPALLPPFYDLTPEEIKGVKEYLYGQDDLNLVSPSNLRTNASYIFTMELHVPDKDKVLAFLDKGMSRPEREAHVIIFRGDKPETYIEEYRVGPLPHPVYKKDHVTQPFRYRPFTAPEAEAVLPIVINKVHNTVGDILKESYGGSLKDCGDTCLTFQLFTPVSGASIGEPHARKFWFWLSRHLEFHTLQNLDFLVLMDMTHTNPDEYTIDKVYYANEMFTSLEEFKQSFEHGGFTKTKVKYPKMSRDLFSSMNRRGTLFPDESLQPPEEYYPSGPRYSIKGRHVSHLGWDFDFRMSSTSGPQLFDIRFQQNRIVYELSLQEISVMYSAHNPAHRFSDFADSVCLIGTRSRGLIPGVDCPKHATFISATHALETSEEAVTVPSAFCLFEHNTAMPLRRHLAYDAYERQFYEGMVDSVLILRTVATVVNYDYIFDFIFHQNGAIQVRATSTGYMLTSFYLQSEADYGFRLRDQVSGTLHHHLFHFKADMDINGPENRFEVIEVTPVTVDNSRWSKSGNAMFSQTKMVRKEVKTERDAALKYNFNTPKYLTFYNNKHKSDFGVPRAYRLLVNGISKQMFPENTGQEASFSWARYQVAVTKYKESERRSSSIYAIWDANRPMVNFQSFIDDNESITDQDQVAWITMGVHHIPHMEDLPVTPTVGLSLEFFILPYNYFDEDPAMGSGDAIRIEPNDQAHAHNGVKFERYGKKEYATCKPETPLFMGTSFDEKVKQEPEVLFNKP